MNVDSGLLLQLGGFILFGDDAVIGSPMSLLTDDSDKSDSDSKVLNVPASSASKNEVLKLGRPHWQQIHEASGLASALYILLSISMQCV
jgi:hypothetical protein